MKKLILFIIFFLINTWSTFAAYDFVGKLDSWASEDNSTYITWIATDSTIVFKTSSFGLTSWTNKISINLPSGFEYQSNNTVLWCDSLNVDTNWNQNFIYTYNWTWLCIFEVNYKIIEAWEKQVILNEYTTDSLTQQWSVTVEATSKITITSAETIDSDENGYIDEIMLYFSEDITSETLSPTSITIWTLTWTLESKSWTSALLSFDDDSLNSWNLPWITIEIPDAQNISWVEDFIPKDKANPVLLKINNSDPSSSISISWKTVTFTFSENLTEESLDNWLSFKKSWSAVAWTFTKNNNIVTFTAASSFTSGTYTFTRNENVVDFYDNKNVDTETSISLSGPVTTSSSGWWWGWGWGRSSCKTNQLICTKYNWWYVYFKKDWVSCTGGNLWKKCTPVTIEEKETTIISKNFADYINENSIDYTSLDKNIADEYLGSKYSNYTWLTDWLSKENNFDIIIEKVTLEPSLNEDYQNLLKNYIYIAENLDNYLQTKDSSYKTKVRENLLDFYKYYNKIKDFNIEEKYISQKEKNNYKIYTTNYEPLAKKLTNLEIVIFAKIDSMNLSESEYQDIVNIYNNFILNLSRFKINKSNQAKFNTIKYLQELLKYLK